MNCQFCAESRAFSLDLEGVEDAEADGEGTKLSHVAQIPISIDPDRLNDVMEKRGVAHIAPLTISLWSKATASEASNQAISLLDEVVFSVPFVYQENLQQLNAEPLGPVKNLRRALRTAAHPILRQTAANGRQTASCRTSRAEFAERGINAPFDPISNPFGYDLNLLVEEDNRRIILKIGGMSDRVASIYRKELNTLAAQPDASSLITKEDAERANLASDPDLAYIQTGFTANNFEEITKPFYEKVVSQIETESPILSFVKEQVEESNSCDRRKDCINELVEEYRGDLFDGVFSDEGIDKIKLLVLFRAIQILADDADSQTPPPRIVSQSNVLNLPLQYLYVPSPYEEETPDLDLSQLWGFSTIISFVPETGTCAASPVKSGNSAIIATYGVDDDDKPEFDKVYSDASDSYFEFEQKIAEFSSAAGILVKNAITGLNILSHSDEYESSNYVNVSSAGVF